MGFSFLHKELTLLNLKYIKKYNILARPFVKTIKMSTLPTPPIGFNFSVYFLGLSMLNNQDTFFQRVGGISAHRNVEEIMEGGANSAVYRLPGHVTYDNLVLERGFTHSNSSLNFWCNSSLNLGSSTIQTKTIIVSLLDYDSTTQTMAWAFFNCYPIKWSVSEFKSTESVLAIETLELSYSRFSPIM